MPFYGRSGDSSLVVRSSDNPRMTFLNCCILASFLHTPSETNELRVMVWNVLHGGNSVQQGPEKALQVIRDAAPDVVLLQESYDIEGDRPKLGAWLAGELGWRQFQGDSAHLCVLTPYDIEATYFHHEWHGVGAELKDPQGRSFVAWSIWLDWRSFVGYELRDHPEMSDAELIEAETKRSGRATQAEALLNHLKKEGHFNESVPVLLGGDFNCPSHLDWTKDTQRVFERRRALDLPVSQLVLEAGFEDSFRQIHPNPVQHPGITWSPMYRGSLSQEKGTPQSFERIDRLYVHKQNEKLTSKLVPVAAHVLPVIWESDQIPAEERTFPSDHGAVVVDFQWISTDPMSK